MDCRSSTFVAREPARTAGRSWKRFRAPQKVVYILMLEAATKRGPLPKWHESIRPINDSEAWHTASKSTEAQHTAYECSLCFHITSGRLAFYFFVTMSINQVI